jgi:hypothetical protein
LIQKVSSPHRGAVRLMITDRMTSPRQHEIVGCGSAAQEFHLAAKRSHFHVRRNYASDVNYGARMALSLRDVRCDPIANRALNELIHQYTVAK